jgi:hypothetical protein
MPKPSRRKFLMIDAIVFVVATSLAMAATRDDWVGLFDHFKPGGEAYTFPFPEFMYQARILLYFLSYFPAAWSLACLVLGLRQPRPALRFVFRQPGMAACLTTAVVLGLRMANVAVSLIAFRAYYPNEDLSVLFLEAREGLAQIPSEIGGAIIAVWVVQAMNGRWRPEPNWVDRLGRALGFYWMATITIASFTWG